MQVRKETIPLSILSNVLKLTPTPIRVNSGNIDVLLTPKEFVEHLRDGISSAQDRIVLASLYFGTGDIEKTLTKDLCQACAKRPDLKVDILLDHSRGTRGKMNSVTTLQPLLSSARPGQVRLSLYKMPQLHRPGPFSYLPSPLNEAVAVQHLKAYVFDDRTLMSGANLSHDYFTDRQDRYISIVSSNLANFYHDVVSCLGTFSAQVLASGKIAELDMNGKDHREDLEQALNGIMDIPSSTEPGKYVSGTWVIPTLQHRPIGIRNDEYAIRALLSNIKGTDQKQGFLNISTAYLNLTNTYSRLLRKRASDIQILTAGPTAHGFASAKGYKSLIPKAYMALEHEIIQKCIQTHECSSSKLFRYTRPGWTYHAKGIWIGYSDIAGYNVDCSHKNMPMISVIGSSNYGYRSVHRDLESQILLISDNIDVQEKLKNEWDNLMIHSEQAIYAKTGKKSNDQRSNESTKLHWAKLAQRFL